MIAFSRPVTVTRQAAGSYVDGHFVPGASETLSVAASVQPLTSRDLLLLEEGDRKMEWIKLFSEFKFKPGEESGGVVTGADTISYNGEKYTVRKVKDWFMQGDVTSIRYYRADAVRNDGDLNNAT